MKVNSKFINQNWKIKVSGFTGKEKIHSLIGVAKLINIIGVNLTETIVIKADEKGIDKVTFRFRRGMKITLYSK
ncbi:MAG: ribosomal large subunit pseudouridine synthase B [Bacteroidales bacterium]|nr:ribosomal large subunit pseudouridine synthase B [Bacteroidales bacterium]